MIYITVELNQDIYIKIPKVKEGISPYNLTMTSQAGGQQMVFADLVNNSDKSSVYRFTLNFTQYTPSGIYNYVLVDSADKVMSKGLIQVNMNNTDDYFYADDELGYFVEEEESGDMSNYYTKSQVDSMLTQYEKKSDLPDFNNFVTEEELGEYVTSEELQQEVESYINSKDLINSTQLANTLEWYVTLNELQSMGYVTASELPTVNNATITIKQGGEVMGSFTLNQANNAEILLNEGGQGGGISMNDVKQYVDSQGYVMSSSLDSMSYVTSDYLDNAGYITTTNVRENYYNKPETEANFTSYAYIEERISRIPGGGITMDEVKDYVVSQSYVTSNELSNTGYITSEYLSNQAYITLNDVPVVDLSSYVTYTYLEERLSEYQPSVDLSAYVTKTELENCSYVTKNALEGNYYSKTDINAMGYITINDVPGVDLSAYVKYSDLNNYGYITAQDIVNQSYVTSSTLNDYATKAYVQEKINEIPGQDLSAYVTKTDLVNQSYITSSSLDNYATKAYVQEKINDIDLTSYATKSDLNSYVKYSDLNNYGYQTSTQVQNTVNTSINSLNSYTLVFTLADDSTVTVIAYTK